MSMPFENRDTTFEQLLQELPPDYRELAIEFKAFARSRKIKTPEQLLQVVMNYCGIDAVLRETAATFTLLEEQISDTAIHRRLKACGPWVKALLSRMMDTTVQPLAEGHLRFLVIDASTVQTPGATGTDYRVHLAIDLVRLHLVDVTVTDEHTGEHLRHYALQDGDVVVVDQGYNQVGMWMDQADRGVGLVVRYNPHGIPLYDPEGNPIDVEAVLTASAATEQCFPVQVRTKQQEQIAGHLHALRLPPEQAAEARRRARAAATKKGRQIQARTLALVEWVLIWTTLPPEVLSTATIMALYQVRWQIELVFKRLKSILNIDCLRARKDSALADVYLHGKLLYAWIVEKRLRRRCGRDWNRLDQPRRATPWRIWRVLQRELTTAIHGARHWNLTRWPEALVVLQERPRRRTLQTVPERIRQLIMECQAQGLSNI
jgi:hypothetical protein